MLGKTVVELDSFLFSVEGRTREQMKGSGHLEEAREPQQLCSPDHPETKCFQSAGNAEISQQQDFIGRCFPLKKEKLNFILKIFKHGHLSHK